MSTAAMSLKFNPFEIAVVNIYILGISVPEVLKGLKVSENFSIKKEQL